jgi:hypothetical protein
MRLADFDGAFMAAVMTMRQSQESQGDEQAVKITIPVPAGLRDRIQIAMIRRGKNRKIQRELREIIEAWVNQEESRYAAESKSEYRTESE